MKIKLNKDYVINGIKIHKNSVIEVLSESKLQEMAKSWTDVRRDLMNEQYVRHEHLTKLFYYRGQNHYKENFDGWVASAKKGLRVSKLKNTNKYPSSDKIFDVIWMTVEDSFDDFLISLVDDLNYEYDDFEKIEEIRYNEVYDFVQKYNLWASKVLSEKGEITMRETMNKIKELLNI